jgi:hypothetical protein
MQNHKIAFTQIGELFFKAGLGHVFDIEPEEDLFTKDNPKKYLLMGLFDELAQGRFFDHTDMKLWEQKGKQVSNEENESQSSGDVFPSFIKW